MFHSQCCQQICLINLQNLEEKKIWKNYKKKKGWKMCIKIYEIKMFVIELKNMEIARFKAQKIFRMLKKLLFELLRCSFIDLSNVQSVNHLVLVEESHSLGVSYRVSGSP